MESVLPIVTKFVTNSVNIGTEWKTTAHNGIFGKILKICRLLILWDCEFGKIRSRLPRNSINLIQSSYLKSCHPPQLFQPPLNIITAYLLKAFEAEILHIE